MATRAVVSGLRYLMASALLIGFASDAVSQVQRRATMLVSNGFANAGQDLQGYWYYDGNEGRQFFRLSSLGGPWMAFHSGQNPRIFEGLQIGQRFPYAETFSGVWGQFKLRDSCLVGLSISVEKRIPGIPPRCPQYQWWDQSQACFSPGGLRDGKLVVNGFRHEAPECVQNKSRPERREAVLTRFVGASFAPVSPQGQYIHVTAVAAPQGYRAVARIVWDYRALQRETGRLLLVRISGHQGAPVSIANSLAVSGTQDIRGESAGRMRLTVSAVDDQGHVVHSDELAVDFPRIPGL